MFLLSIQRKQASYLWMSHDSNQQPIPHPYQPNHANLLSTDASANEPSQQLEKGIASIVWRTHHHHYLIQTFHSQYLNSRLSFIISALFLFLHVHEPARRFQRSVLLVIWNNGLFVWLIICLFFFMCQLRVEEGRSEWIYSIEMKLLVFIHVPFEASFFQLRSNNKKIADR